ncbi:iron-sulfur-binding protein [Deltaproteobacteria bacterium]|nr:iron-sulfur-binding protein [Deltaproteobacteria bacterium]
MDTQTVTPSPVAADAPAVRLTEGAVTHIKRMLTENQMEGYGLRFGIQGGGCSGYSYQLEFEEAPQPEDEVYTFDGVRVFLNPLHKEYLNGSEVDFRDELIGAGFHIENPNVKRSCGCGTSFDV